MKKKSKKENTKIRKLLEGHISSNLVITMPTPTTWLEEESDEILKNFSINNAMQDLAISDLPIEILNSRRNVESLYNVPGVSSSFDFTEQSWLGNSSINFQDNSDYGTNSELLFLTEELEDVAAGISQEARYLLEKSFAENVNSDEILLKTVPEDKQQQHVETSEETKIQLLDNCVIDDPELVKCNKETDELVQSEKSLNQDSAAAADTTTRIFAHKVPDESVFSHLKPILGISDVETNKSLDWAEVIDIQQSVNDFHERVPNPAKTYPFELDIFQKQAIIKLEENKHVLVAAHTSAGKTVVAEYAIALSQNHGTKAVYTSPIKALSNQKYRDFKLMFKDVGLITGDWQINPTASCLIMTTEILRSMLYCGSETTRDLEYVIFDEVHYINDVERGHVWEEVLILLPDHISIIMLSATVPNTLEFANWVGATKRKKVYVISTLKRPVPLKHYLYTGMEKKTKNDIYLLVNENGEFLSEKYNEAVRKKKSANLPDKMLTPKQEKVLWATLISYLTETDKFPVIAFTLSRKRCDDNAAALAGQDLCKDVEKKHYVKQRFARNLAQLKPDDRILPQVLKMENSLMRGIGVHHSGILPILKETVEMLFQEGYVKLLFATETFAIGVNMPARTVVFDSHEKYDGSTRRNLEPAEYIQMAGRAGRRGHDPNGTVILICKTKVPPQAELHAMMLGRPRKLESKFSPSYSMILTLLRFERFSVEDMLSHSFKEFGLTKRIPDIVKELQNTVKELADFIEIPENQQQLCKFFDYADEYIKEWNCIMTNVLSQQKTTKDLQPGRVIVVSQGSHYNKLGILLSVITHKTKETAYKVLVLDHCYEIIAESKPSVDHGEKWHKMLALMYRNVNFVPKGNGGHCVLSIRGPDIEQITNSNIKINPDVIIQNWEQRQIPRFHGTEPGPSVIKAVAELNDLNNAYIAKSSSIKFNTIWQDFIYTRENVKVLTSIENIAALSKSMKEILLDTNISNLEQDFEIVFNRKTLEKKVEELKFKISKQNLSLYPDYCSKRKVLKKLEYVDEHDDVTVKGRVACGMGQNELIITELILSNMFIHLDSAEIAGLLSSLVFQAKTTRGPRIDLGPEKKLPDDAYEKYDKRKENPIISEKLKEYIQKMRKVDKEISAAETEHEVSDLGKPRLNFGLVAVISEWARKKPFSKIMKMTDVQEGIIVRCIQQLDEVLRDVKNAAMTIGNSTLETKMEEASEAIRRDIVFTPSLYTTDEIIDETQIINNEE